MRIFFLAVIYCTIFSIQSVFAQNFNLQGVVTEKISGNPVYNAHVYFKGTTIGTATDRGGHFCLKNIKSGIYQLVISKLGYNRVSEKIDLKKNFIDLQYKISISDSSLDEIVVTGTSTPHHIKNAPVQTELISKRQIEQTAPSDFTELMLNISPSFDFTPRSMGPFMRLNGLSNDYILFLIDGKRMYGDIGGQTDLNRINPENVQKIEIVKGASSALYGSEAIAGVINIITRQPRQKVYLSNNTRVGGYGKWIQNNKLSINLGKFSSHTSFDRKQTDGWQLNKYELNDEKLVETDEKAVDESSDYTINQKLTYAPMQNLSIYLQGSKYERDVKKPKSVRNYGFFYDNFTYAGGAKYLLKKGNYIKADWHSDNFRYYYKYNQQHGDYANGDKIIQTEQLRDAFNIKSMVGISHAHLIIAGVDYVNEELESAGRLEGEKASAYTNAVFVQDEIKLLTDFTLVAGVRFVNHKEFGNAFTPKLAALYKLNNVNLRATYARGFKAPTLKELYYRYHYQRFNTLYLGNPSLNPQTSDYYSASVEYHSERFSASISVYQNRVNDLIDYQTVETAPEDTATGISRTRQHYNISKAQTTGADMLFNAEIGRGFTLGGGYSFVDAKNLTDDIRLENVAQNYGNIRLGYHHNWNKYHLSAVLNGRFQDEKFFEDERNAKAYNIWKLTTTHCFDIQGPFDLTVVAGINNILDYVDDSLYGSHYGTINPGRTFFTGLNIEFAR